MKTPILGFVLLLVIAAGCKKEEADSPTPITPPVTVDSGRVQLLNIGEYRFRVDTNGVKLAEIDKLSNKIVTLKTGSYLFNAVQLEGLPYGTDNKKSIEIKKGEWTNFVFP